MNSIFSRVSIRKYQDKPVEKEKIEAILRAAMQAPSAANQQPWEFYVVTNNTGGYCFSLSEGLCSPGLRPDRSGHLHGEPLAGNQRAGSWRCMAGDCADGGTYAGCGENLRSSRYGSGLCAVPFRLSCGGEKAAGQV